MGNALREHFPVVCMLGALGMFLVALVMLAMSGQKPDSPILLGLVSAASGMGGAIGGFSMNSSRTQQSTKSPAGDTTTSTNSAA